jgi:hypothetical protein
MFHNQSLAAGLTLLAAGVPFAANACSSCGCTLSSDWASQGYAAEQGIRIDMRFDYFDQSELRSGAHSIARGRVAIPAEQEVQQSTLNRNYTLSLDYSPNADWGINLQIPYFNRFHTTIAEGDTDISASHTESMGDVRLLVRYQGFSQDHTTGVQAGLKFATGSFDNNFISGPQQGNLLDRGLQPGTGTTDLIVGLYHFGTLSRDWDYFAQGYLQQPLNYREDFRPGTGLNVNAGVRFVRFNSITPHLQLNVRAEKRESGAEADVENSGATLVYLSPGVTAALSHHLSVYGFVQVPVYQRVNGLQIEPRYTASAGVHYAF